MKSKVKAKGAKDTIRNRRDNSQEKDKYYMVI
jgi:hypothetical protein